MKTVRKSRRKPDTKTGLQTIGGTAAGAAIGSLMGPVGAAVGAVVGGIAGANAREIANSKPVKRMKAATKRRVSKAPTRKAPVQLFAARKKPKPKKRK